MKLVFCLALGCLSTVFAMSMVSPKELESKVVLKSDSFPLGMYGVYSVRIDDMAKVGFNYVQHYGLSWDQDGDKLITEKDMEVYKAYLDEAEKNDVKVLFNLDAGKHRDTAVYRKVVRDVVLEFSNHPALGMWAIFDEPDAYGNVHGPTRGKGLTATRSELQRRLPRELLGHYEYLKTQDSIHQTLLVVADSYFWWDYMKSADIIAYDKYPIKKSFCNESFDAKNNLNLLMKNGLKIRGRYDSLKLLPIQQAYDRGCRLPSKEELRHWAFGSLTLGVEGLFWYASHEIWKLGDKKANTFLQKDMAPILSEVKDFVNAVDTIRKPVKINLENAIEDVYLKKWKGEDADYWVLVNASSKSNRLILIKTEDLKPYTSISVWGSGRGNFDTSLSVNKFENTLSVIANPWEVFIWKMK